MEDHHKLKIAFENYVATLNKIEERRKLWNEETRNIISTTLKSIESEFKHRWCVQELIDTENSQAINISFHSMPSGIADINLDIQTGKPRKIKKYVKHGGYLCYSQSFNGKIHVMIGFPYIEEWVSQKETEHITTLEPEQITEELITIHVIKFLETMQQWEDSYADRTTVGFKLETKKAEGYPK